MPYFVNIRFVFRTYVLGMLTGFLHFPPLPLDISSCGVLRIVLPSYVFQRALECLLVAHYKLSGAFQYILLCLPICPPQCSCISISLFQCALRSVSIWPSRCRRLSFVPPLIMVSLLEMKLFWWFFILYYRLMSAAVNLCLSACYARYDKLVWKITREKVEFFFYYH